ncbi:hypothetical protein C8R47DRAFT_1089126 [Mycena vitilis]|nr:hypothetical protein C8R47DRAFT_1089126 [Mycena vitilis]
MELVAQIFATFCLYQRAFFAKSLAFSRKLNTRNLESYWYIVWNHTLIALVEGLPRFLIAPQYFIWCVEAEIEVPVEPEGNDDDEDVAQDVGDDADSDPLHLATDPDELEDSEEDLDAPSTDNDPPDDDENFYWEGDNDKSSNSHRTITQPHATSQIADFAIVEVDTPLRTDTSIVTSALGAVFTALSQKAALVSPMKHLLSSRRTGLPIQTQTIRVLVEIKRFTHRHTVGTQFEGGLTYLLVEAQTQALKQAAVLFCMKETDAKVVLLIAAAGPYYTMAYVRRKHRFSAKKLQAAIDDKDVQKMVDLSVKQPGKWMTPLYLGSPASNKRLVKVRSRLDDWAAFEATYP